MCVCFTVEKKDPIVHVTGSVDSYNETEICALLE